MMDSTERERLSILSTTLRSELKVWEKAFASSNDGRKASRDDIKNSPEIAAKYKEYNRIRDVLAGKAPYQPPPPPSTTNQTPRKRKRDDGENNGQLKRPSMVKTPSRTPSKNQILPWEVDPYVTPSAVRSLFTPSRKAIGPTPQKDGVVLGIFDILEEGSKSNTFINSPSAQKTSLEAATPRKQKEDIFETLKHSRTPASTSKRQMLNAFATPQKGSGLYAQESHTPSTVSKLHFSTPSFLRRDSQRINLGAPSKEGDLGGEISPQAVRVPRKPLVRGLSSILAGLRKIEEDAADDDLEALHELEADEAAGKAKPRSRSAPNAVQVKDSQQQDFLLGGFDDEAKYDTDIEEELGPDGQPLKVYKKKGQKRTTRRVKMKPSRAKPQTLPTPDEDSETDEDNTHGETQTVMSPSVEENHGDEDAVPETQFDQFADARNYDSDTQSEYTASEGGTRRKRIGRSRKEKKAERQREGDGKIRKGLSKVTALANQNFKRLKLRNRGAKGGPGVGSKFRRRR